MDELAKIALVGTSKSRADVPLTGHPAATLLAGLPVDDREGTLLLASGLAATYRLAGQRPIPGVTGLAIAPTETGRIASPRVAAILRSTLAAGGQELLVGFLEQMAERQTLLPFDLLPQMLDWATEKTAPSVRAVFGERGSWLCRSNPNWSWGARDIVPTSDSATDPTELRPLWDEGTVPERREALELVRRRDPATGRDWLAQAFPQEKPADRASLLDALRIGLSPEDEPFLEECLADRSTLVVQSAARLLALLPGSGLSARMVERADSMMTGETKGLLRKKTKLACAPPEQVPKEWERDGIPRKAPAGRGLRALCVEVVLTAVRPSYWVDRFGLDATKLIEAVDGDPFEGAVITGWTQAATAFAAHDPRSAEWLLPLWRFQYASIRKKEGRDRREAFDQAQALLRAMPAPHAESALIAGLEEWTDVEPAMTFLPILPPRWGADFSGRLLAILRRVVKKGSSDAAYQWATLLATTGRALSPKVFPQALAPWELTAVQASTWHSEGAQREVDRFLETIQTRQEFCAALDESK